MIWDFWAKYYDRLWVQRLSLGPTRKLVTAAVQPRLATATKPLAILDIGCGTGQQYGDLLALPTSDRLQYRGIDASPRMIAAARAKFPAADFRLCDVAALQATPSWDILICSHSFPYYANGERLLAQFSQMLAPGGQLLLAQACRNTLFDYLVLSGVECTTGRARYRSVQRMQALGQPLFASLELSCITNKLFMPSLYLFRWQQ